MRDQADRIDPGPLAGRQILVVERNSLLQAAIETTLRAAGAAVVVLHPTDASLQEVGTRHALDGAVLELDLASAPIWSLAKALTERGLPVLLYAGHTLQRPAVRLPYLVLGIQTAEEELVAELRDLLSPQHSVDRSRAASAGVGYDAALRIVKCAMNSRKDQD